MITRVLMETLAVPDLASAVAAWTRELGFEVRAEGTVEGALSAAWDFPERARAASCLLASPGTSRGFIRLVEGDADESGSFHRAGLFNAELLCADVDRLYGQLGGSKTFRLVSTLNTYDLSSTGGATSRSFATRGPGGAGVFFTTYLRVPPPRTLPKLDGLVGPMFNSAVAVAPGTDPGAFYAGVLGMQRRLEGRLAQPSINRILGLPDDWGFHMVVYKGEGDGLIEVDVHEHPLPAREEQPGRLPGGNAALTLEAGDLDEILRRAQVAGVPRGGGVAVRAAPYDGRRLAVLRGPAGEVIEVVGA